MLRSRLVSLFVTPLAVFLAVGCEDKDTSAENGSDTSNSTDASAGFDSSDGGFGTNGTETSISATLSGSVQVELYCTDGDGARDPVSFADAYGGAVWVGAYHQRNGSLAYYGSDTIGDPTSFDWADLIGQSSLTYDMVVPANTVVVLWSYADEDVDGYVNETGDAVASGSSDSNDREIVGTNPIMQDFGLAHVAAS
jgi:hypothetical protein